MCLCVCVCACARAQLDADGHIDATAFKQMIEKVVLSEETIYPAERDRRAQSFVAASLTAPSCVKAPLPSTRTRPRAFKQPQYKKRHTTTSSEWPLNLCRNKTAKDPGRDRIDMSGWDEGGKRRGCGRARASDTANTATSSYLLVMRGQQGKGN